MSLSKVIGVVSGINEFGNLFQLVKSAASYLRSKWSGVQESGVQECGLQESGVQEQQIQEHEVLQLQSDLRDLSETLPSIYNLIDQAEWSSHKKCVAELLPKLNDAVYDAEDLLDEFRWYNLKVLVEGNSTQLSPLIEFFRSVTQGSFNKVTDIQKRINNLSSQLEKMGLREATPRFDKSVRPVTTSFPTEPKVFGRENEMAEVVRLLGVPKSRIKSSTKRKRTCNEINNEPRTSFIPVLPIVGIGGVGKTTLAQEITTLQSVKSHFDNNTYWICVSDEFDAELLTRDLYKSLSGEHARADNFDDLQKDLVNEAGKKKFLLVLDDIWPDAWKEDGRSWRRFCAPLKNVLQGSMLLVTTRFAEIADSVGTIKSFALEGLEPGVFWDLFKLCVFGYEKFNMDSQLEMIGRRILPKLKGSPLAAKTIGRLLRKSLTTEHWNDILNSELWELRQEETDILPALRLSYMYLPFHLKRCFSFCAVYPKDYKFQKDSLAEIWVAEGFIEPQGNIPLQHIGAQYFEDLVNLSFFQKHRGKYVIHDLIHDMAQLVSKEECFNVKDVSDFERVPQNVRHFSIPASSDSNVVYLKSLCKHKKLRTLLCKSGRSARVMYTWFSELQCLRVISLALMREYPESISNLKHLRYLEISKDCYLDSLPSSFCHLYNLQIICARRCIFVTLPIGLSKLINLQKFEVKTVYKLEVDALQWRWFVNTFLKYGYNGHLIIYNIGAISMDNAAEIRIREMEYLNRLSLRWSSVNSKEHNEIEVVSQALRPPTKLKTMNLEEYPGGCLPSWLCCSDLPCLETLIVSECPNITSGELLFPSLKYLDLTKSGILGGNIECCSLTRLNLSYSNLTSIQVEKWNLPALWWLTIEECNYLTCIGVSNQSYLRDGTFSNGVFASLTTLYIHGCSKLLIVFE